MNKNNNEKGLLQLIKSCQKQHEKSQEELYRQFYSYAMSISIHYSKTKEEAQEIVNDAFYKVFTRLDQYDPKQSFKGWLRKILINSAIDHTRKFQMACTWNNYRQSFLATDSVLLLVDELSTQLAEAQQRNFVRWPILNIKVWPNTLEGKSYEEEVALTKDWIVQRLAWLDENLPGPCSKINNLNENELQALVYPNPIQDQTNIEYYIPHDSRVNLTLYDVHGRLITQILVNEIQRKGGFVQPINTAHLAAGIYFLRLKAVDEIQTFKLMKL